MAAKLKNGKYRGSYYDAEGIRQREVFETKAAAEAFERRGKVHRDNVRTGLAPAPQQLRTVGMVWEGWLANRPADRQLDDTSRGRNHVLPFFKDDELRAIDDKRLLEFANFMTTKKAARKGQKSENAKPLSRGMIKNCLILICKLLGDHGYHPKLKYVVPTSGFAWLKEEAHVARFLDECREPEWFHVAASLAVYSGLRAGEVLGLECNKVDFKLGQVLVDRAYKRKGKKLGEPGIDGPVKSKHLRYVPLAPALAEVLKPWLRKHKEKFVVLLPDGGRPKPESLAPYTERACKRAEVTIVNFHQLRHTCASHLAQRTSLPVVGAMFGHADPKTTKRYSHLDSEDVARSPKMHLDFRVPVTPTQESTPSE